MLRPTLVFLSLGLCLPALAEKWETIALSPPCLPAPPSTIPSGGEREVLLCHGAYSRHSVETLTDGTLEVCYAPSARISRGGGRRCTRAGPNRRGGDFAGRVLRSVVRALQAPGAAVRAGGHRARGAGRCPYRAFEAHRVAQELLKEVPPIPLAKVRVPPAALAASNPAVAHAAFAQVDATKENAAATKYYIRAYPTIKLFRKGAQAAECVAHPGTHPSGGLRRRLTAGAGTLGRGPPTVSSAG